MLASAVHRGIFGRVPSDSEEPKLGARDISEALRFSEGDQAVIMSPAAGRLVSGSWASASREGPSNSGSYVHDASSPGLKGVMSRSSAHEMVSWPGHDEDVS